MDQLPSDTNPNATITLEQAKEKLRTLLLQGESDAWEIGDLLNWIEKRGLVRAKGYGKTKSWLDAEVPESFGKTTTFYNWANVASYYSKEHVNSWGVTRLEYLIAHDQQTVEHAVPGNPAERELELYQEDGSTTVKKFLDCSARELRRSNQLRKKARQQPIQRLATAPRTRKGAAPAAQTDTSPAQIQLHSLRTALLMMVSGAVVTMIASVLPTSIVTSLIFLIGFGLSLSGIATIVRKWNVVRERLVQALDQGKAVEMLKGEIAKARRGAGKVLLAIRSGIKTHEPKGSEEAIPRREEKKAA